MPNYLFEETTNEILPIGKIICLARNYKKHAIEMNAKITTEPVFFLKPASSVIFNGGSIIIPRRSKKIHYELEFGVVISKKCKKVKREFALDYVLGYLIGLDITARDIQSVAKKEGLHRGFPYF